MLPVLLGNGLNPIGPVFFSAVHLTDLTAVLSLVLTALDPLELAILYRSATFMNVPVAIFRVYLGDEYSGPWVAFDVETRLARKDMDLSDLPEGDFTRL